MPTVRKYVRQVSTAAAPAVERTPLPAPPRFETPIINYRPTPEQFGAGLGAEIETIGAQMLARQQAKADQARLDSEQRVLQDWELQNIYDPQKGALQKVGGDAIGLGQQVEDSYDKFVAQRRESLGNDRQRQAYDQLTTARRNQVLLTVTKYEAAQTESFHQNELKASLSNHQNLAALNAGDPLRVSDEVAGVQSDAQALARMNGWGPEQTTAFATEAVSKTHRSVIEQLAGTNYINAKTYYEAKQDKLTAEDKAAVNRVLEESTLRGESQRQADQIWASKPDATLSEIQDEAAKIRDPNIRDAVQSRLEARWRAKRQDTEDQTRQLALTAKDQLDRGIQDALNAIDAGAPRDLAGVHRLVDRVHPGLWAELDAQTRDRLETYAKKYTEKGKIETDPRVYYSLIRQAGADPDGFAKRDLIRDGSVSGLSPSDFQEMARLQLDIRKGNAKEAGKTLDGIRSTERMISTTLREAGIDPSDKDNQGTIDQLWSDVDADVRRLQEATGKKATDDDVQKIIDQRLMDRQVAVPGSWSGLITSAPFFSQEKAAAAVTPEDVERSGDVHLIPLQDRRQIEEALRRAHQPINEQTILDLYIKTQQRLRQQKGAK